MNIRPYIILNDVSSLTIQGLIISSLPAITKPQIRTQIRHQRQKIPGTAKRKPSETNRQRELYEKQILNRSQRLLTARKTTKKGENR